MLHRAVLLSPQNLWWGAESLSNTQIESTKRIAKAPGSVEVRIQWSDDATYSSPHLLTWLTCFIFQIIFSIMLHASSAALAARPATHRRARQELPRLRRTRI